MTAMDVWFLLRCILMKSILNSLGQDVRPTDSVCFPRARLAFHKFSVCTYTEGLTHREAKQRATAPFGLQSQQDSNYTHGGPHGSSLYNFPAPGKVDFP